MLTNFHNCQQTILGIQTLTKAYKFADDDTVTVTRANVNVCHEVLLNICNELQEWCSRWRLLINCNQNKTEVIIIHANKLSDNDVNPPLLRIGNHEINRRSRAVALASAYGCFSFGICVWLLWRLHAVASASVRGYSGSRPPRVGACVAARGYWSIKL